MKWKKLTNNYENKQVLKQWEREREREREIVIERVGERNTKIRNYASWETDSQRERERGGWKKDKEKKLLQLRDW